MPQLVLSLVPYLVGGSFGIQLGVLFVALFGAPFGLIPIQLGIPFVAPFDVPHLVSNWLPHLVSN